MGQSRIVPIAADTVDIPSPGMFASADWRVISRHGENYYRACGEVVQSHEQGGHTTCVKPLHHPTWQHEDFEGRIKDTVGVVDIEFQIRMDARNVLKRTGLSEEQIFNALNALSSSGVNLIKESRDH